MTDTYGTEPHDHENEHDEHHDHDVHEPPSDYEFADPSVTEEHIDDNSSGALESTPARRSPALPIVAAVGGVLLLGAVAWWQFGSVLMAPASSSPVTGNNAVISSMLAVTPPVASANNTPDQPKQATNAVLPSVSVAPKVASVETPAPVVTALPAATVVAAPVVVAPVPTSMPAVQTQTNGAIDQRIGTLTTRIEDVQKQLEQTNKQLEQVANMVAANVGTAEADAKAKNMQDRLDKIEQRLATTSKTAAPAAVPALAAPEALPSVTVVTSPAEPQPAVSTAVVKHNPVHKPVHKAKVEHRKPADISKQAVAAPTWILRAASPGQAWVSTSTTSRELKPLQVGDTFAGIGKVTAIQQKDGNWIVQGTRGTIQ